MVKKFKNIVTLMVFGILPCTAFAAPTVVFEGQIADQTCSVSLNGQTNSVIMLPTVSISDFGSPLTNGQTAGLTPFTVTISDCTAFGHDLNIATKFLGYDVDVASGVLGNRATTSPAAGFGIQLTASSDGTVPVILSGPTSVAGLKLASGASSTSHDFAAQYYVLDAAVAQPGKITAVAEYTLSYF